MRGFLLPRGRTGVDHDRMLELEELTAMDEGGGVRSHAVVRATPRHEIQLAGLALGSVLYEGLHQRGDGFGWQWPVEELRSGDEIRLLRRRGRCTRRIPAFRITQLRPKLPRLRERHVLGRRPDWIRARPN